MDAGLTAIRCTALADLRSVIVYKHQHGATSVPFSLSPRSGIHTAREAHHWFLSMMREHEEFEVETDRAGEWPVPFSSDTVRRVVVVSRTS